MSWNDDFVAFWLQRGC